MTDELKPIIVAPTRRIIDENGVIMILHPDGSMETTSVNNGFIDEGNSSIIPLPADTGGSDHIFTGEAMSVLDFVEARVSVFSDVASADDGMSIQYSMDGVNWDHDDLYTVPASKGKNYVVQRVADFYRVVYTNGTTPQTALRLRTLQNRAASVPSSHRLKDDITSDDDATLGISVLKTVGRDPEKFHTVDAGHPLPVADYDNSHRGAANSIFGDRIVGTRVPTIAAQFQYGLRSDDAVVDTVTTGAVVIEDSMLKLNTGTDAAGHVGIQGADFLRYIPGHEAYAFFTSVFATPAADLIQRIGLFDFDGGDGNGFFIGYEGLVFGVTRRRMGIDTFTAVDVATVFSGHDGTFDPEKGNVYKISYGYLGFATIHFEILLPHGGFVELAAIEYPNTSTETHIANTNIPLRAEMTNTGSTVDSQMKIGSVTAGIVDGGGSDPIARTFTFAIPTTALGVATTTQLLTFRNKATYFGITNKITTQLKLISAATDGNKPVRWGIKQNPDEVTPDSATWNDVSVDSVMEYSSDFIADLNTGHDSLLWNMSRADSFFEDVEDYVVKLRPNEVATIYAISQTASDIDLSIRWRELF